MAFEPTVIDAEPPGEGVVALLEDALLRAHKGEYSCVMLVTIDRAGCAGGGWSRVFHYAAMFGAMELLKHRLLKKFDS